jgi:hypothetical protein
MHHRIHCVYAPEVVAYEVDRSVDTFQLILEPVTVSEVGRREPLGQRGAESRWRQPHDVVATEDVDERVPERIGFRIAMDENDCHEPNPSTLGSPAQQFLGSVVTTSPSTCGNGDATGCGASTRKLIGMNTTHTMKKTIVGGLLAGGVALAALGLGAGEAGAAPSLSPGVSSSGDGSVRVANPGGISSGDGSVRVANPGGISGCDGSVRVAAR